MRIQGKEKKIKKEQKTYFVSIMKSLEKKVQRSFLWRVLSLFDTYINIYHQIQGKILLMIDRIFYTNKRGDLHGLVD